ncbi:MAG: glucosaminidase domain-containing protein [Thermodesulfobacteriota bacterium]
MKKSNQPNITIRSEDKPSVFTLPWFAFFVLTILLAMTLFMVTSQRQLETYVTDAAPGKILTASGKRAHYPNKTLEVKSAQEVWDFFDSSGYTLENLKAGDIDVPRVFLTRIASDWSANHTISFKKNLFFRSMLPLVLRSNELIRQDRDNLLALWQKHKEGQPLSADDNSWLTDLAKMYRVMGKGGDQQFRPALFRKLLKRVDEIPVSMALAQTAYESAYATSRFAGEGNSLFGQWRWGSGLTPKGQRTGMGDYRIADFDTPLQSAISFANNLNTNKAYREFRDLRARLRAKETHLSGHALASTLIRYSEKGEYYVRTVQAIIKANNLGLFDRTTLGGGTPVSLVPNWDSPILPSKVTIAGKK